MFDLSTLRLVNADIIKTISVSLSDMLSEGFMQDKIIASHTCFGGHMDVNC